MANSFSPIRQYGDYIQPYDFNLLAKGLEYKQARFDANAAKIQEQINQFAQVELAKSQDVEYFNNRVQQLVDGLNGLSSAASFDSTGFTRNIQNQVRQVYDQNVINAIASTQRANQLRSEIADVKKNSPDKYALQNEMFATRSLNAWLNDGQVGSVYRGGSYSPFYNIQKELLPVMKNLHNFADVEKVTTPDGNGYFVTKSGKRLTENEVRQVAEGLLGPQANSQLQIDGWYNFARGKNALENTRARFSDFKAKELGKFDSRIADLNVRLSSLGQGQGSQRQQLLSQLNDLRGQRDSLDDVYGSWMISGDVDNMAFTMQKDKLFSSLGAAYGFQQTETTYSTDQGFWKAQELEFKRWKALFDAQNEARKTGATGTNPLDSNQDGIPDIRQQARVTDPEGDIDLLGDAESTIETNTQLRNKLLNDKFDSLPSNLRGDIDVLFENRTDKSITREDFLFDYFRTLAQDGTSPGIIGIAEFEQINQAQNKIIANTQVLNESFKTAFDEQEAEILPQLFEIAQKNPGIRIAQEGTLGETEVVSLSELFEQNGIESYEDLENNPVLLDQFKKQVYADAILSSRAGQTDFSIKRLASLFGEGDEDVPELNPVVGMVSVSAGVGAPGVSSPVREFSIPTDSNTMKKTMAFLTKVFESGAFDINNTPFTNDDSFQDDRESNRLLDMDNIRSKMNSIIAGRTSDLPQRNEFVIQPGSNVHKELRVVVDGQTNNSFLSVDGVAFSIALSPDDPGSAVIKQKIKEGTSDGARNISDNEALVPLQNLPESVLRTINFSTERPLFNSENFVSKERGRVRFIDEVNTPFLEELNDEVFQGNQQLLQIATEQGAALNLFRTYPDLLGGYTQPTQVGQLVRNVLEDDQFSVVATPTKNRDGVRVSVNYGTGEGAQTVYSPNQSVSFDNFDQLNKIIDYAPQIVVHNMLEAMLLDLRNNGGTIPNGALQKLAGIYFAE